MYVNVNNGEHLDFGETAKTTSRRRFLGATTTITYIHERIQEFSSGLTGGGSKPEWQEKFWR